MSSTSSVITRPVWRSFTQRFLVNAAEHVRAGGHAMIWRPGPGAGKPVAWMLLPCDAEGSMPELSFWSLLAIYKDRFEIIERGPAKGLATVRIPRDYEEAVERWCERDSMWRGTTREVELDCVKCAACCKRNHVILDDDDYARWHAAGRDDLRARAFTRREDGKVLLRLQKSGDCVHLNGTLCGIYAVRPDNCSSFPAGSECCLESRYEEFDLVDGARSESAG